MDAHRVWVADCVGELNLATVREAGGHDVLGDVAAHVSGAAVNLRGVFSGKRPAAVPAHAAVGVDDDFPSGETGVALGTADHEASGRVDEKFRRGVEEILRDNLADHVGDEEAPDLVIFYIFRVLGRDDDVRHADGPTVLIKNGNLAFCIRAQPLDLAAFADAGEFASEAVGEHDRCRHEFGSLIAGVAEHESLIARALFLGSFAGGGFGVHTLRDVRALAGQVVIDKDTVGMKDVVVIDVSDFADRCPDDLADIEGGIQRGAFQARHGDFATHDDHVAFDKSFAGDPARAVEGQAGVEDRVGNGVANFVGMAFANGFGGKNITA